MKVHATPQLPPKLGPGSGEAGSLRLTEAALLPLKVLVREGPSAVWRQSIRGRACSKRGSEEGIWTDGLHGLGNDGVSRVSCTIRCSNVKYCSAQPPLPFSGLGASLLAGPSPR